MNGKFLPLLFCLLAVHGVQPAAAEEPLPGADHFAIVLGPRMEVGVPARPGALRAPLDGGVLLGGGAEGAFRWPERDAAVPRDAAVLLAWDGVAWSSRPVGLPEPVAWAATARHGGGLIVAGGLRAGGISDRVSLWRVADGAIVAEELPPLPLRLAWAGASVMDGFLHVAGGTGPDGDNLGILRINLSATDAGWTRVPLDSLAAPWLEPLLEVRRDEKAVRNALFLFGGWHPPEGDSPAWRPARQVFKFIPAGKQAGLTLLAPSPEDRLLYTATPLGPSHILAAAVDRRALDRPPALVPRGGFPGGEFVRYHLFTNTWAPFSTPLHLPVTLLAGRERARLDLGLVGADGHEVLHAAEIRATERHFTLLDYGVMALYMLGLVAIGKYFASRERGTEDFFLGGRRVPWWAAGLSIYATGTSAISFMAIPAKTYATDWLYFIGMSIFPFFTVLIAAFVFVPLLRRLELTTVMEYFELRFGRPVRLLMSAVAVLGQVAGRMSITLLLPSIALAAVTGMNIYLCILVMGVLATLYTAAGGINAVIWTDVLQVFVLFGGALLSFALIVLRVDGGLAGMYTLAVADDKFHFLDWSWDFTTATMWVMILWAVSDVFGKGLGQEGLQRAFSTKGVKEARRSMITCAVVALPAGFLFYGIGTALYAFYHSHPQLLNPTLQTDAIFPLFIAQQLPAGLAGLVISGLFAAAMSTLDTSMNTSATILVRDFYSIWRKDRGDHERLAVARAITVACGAIGTGIALYMARFENLGSLWDLFSILLGVIGGGLGGVGFLALCTTRATTWGTLAGALVTAVCMVCIQRFTPVHFFIYGTISMVIGSTTGYLFSLFLPERAPKDLTGLTIWTSR